MSDNEDAGMCASRRELLAWLIAGPLATLMPGSAMAAATACRKVPESAQLVDAHCHIFNASDLPAERFLRYVLLDMHPRQAESALDIHDPDVVDGIIALMTWVLGRNRAPTARVEIAMLERDRRRGIMAGAIRTSVRNIEKAVGDFLVQHSGALGVGGGSRGEGKVADAIFAAGSGRGPVGAAGAPFGEGAARQTARKAYASKTDIGTYLRWFELITRYRHDLADQLQQDYACQGISVKMLSPALIDYDKWLGQDVRTSPMPDQVEVMDCISQRDKGPVVHGYVAFDPLRQAYHDADLDAGFDPIDLVKLAIRDKGFVGVKLYPPMGFKPIGNGDGEQKYPADVVRDLKGGVGIALDRSLAKLYDTCTKLDAPIIAHAARSNGAGPNYADRADPAFWIPVFDRWPRLRVCLAHFGRFDAPSAAGGAGSLPDTSWEWTFGRYIAAHPDRPVFADISYLANVLASPDVVSHTAARFRDFVARFDPEVRHLVFGSDWIMLGLENRYPDYAGRVIEFLRQSCGFDQPRIDRILHQNAGRFLGLGRGNAAWSRLSFYYSRNQLSLSRLKQIQAT
ncbi:amidohydrolase family protein [Sphingomonas sp. BK235]|uniref:amidohydrolase family protein n=1 Tax=Sphingomonas sp. BK235 TaxID=2512131 RepID=UPI0010CE8833|nr:amidohydrolase family protein [Sphingomonas sp. BK235]TCP30115.1 amidohydrolase family protein [Sphingomonas sp. BK235]